MLSRPVEARKFGLGIIKAAKACHPGFCTLLLLLALTAPLAAQTNTATFKVEKIEVGFPRYSDVTDGAFKSGLWTPVYVTFARDETGNIVLPLGVDGLSKNVLTLSIVDGEGMQGTYKTGVELGRTDKTTTLIYANPGAQRPNINLNLLPGKDQPGGSKQLPSRAPNNAPEPRAMSLDSHLYLTIGTKLPSFEKAIAAMPGLASHDDMKKARQAAFETEAERLPDLWFGYQAVDVLILTTDNKQFVEEFFSPKTLQGEKRTAALIEWVRRGGQMVLSVSKQNQERVHKFLQSNQWQPPFPSVLSPNKRETVTSMSAVHQWAGASTLFPASPTNPFAVASLQPDKSMEVLITGRTEDAGAPLMVRIPYGRGSVVLVAFELDRNPFSAWEGNVKFWQRLVTELGPKVRAIDEKNGMPVMGGGGNFGRDGGGNDVATQLHRELDQFNVPMISFGWVALFIILYILIVGPVDYLILKKVFKRLEWTWITFPAIVILISVAAYFAAYALKGNQMKVNKVDLVDIDMRTYLDKDYKPKKAYAYGNTWVGILSPRIQNYTIGIKPVLGNWVGDPEANPQVNETMVTWFGRPEEGGPGAYGKARSASLFRRAYDYGEDAAGLKDIPIPVWTTRSLTASWEAKFDLMPFTIDLGYKANDPDQRMSGTLQNNLPVDLEDVYLIYGQKYYLIDQALPAPKEGKPVAVSIKEGDLQTSDLPRWLGKEDQPIRGNQPGKYGFATSGDFLPTPILKQLYFFDKVQPPGGSSRNHLLRALDQSWRIVTHPLKDDKVRTAILVGKLARAEGPIEELTAANDPRLPTQLWLGALPSESQTRPTLSGTIVQNTYIRVFVSVRPKE